MRCIFWWEWVIHSHAYKYAATWHSLALKLRWGSFSFTHCRTKQTAFVSPNTINHIQCKNKNQPQGLVCVFGGSGWIRTTSVVRQQIYSLPRLSNSGARPELLSRLCLLQRRIDCPPSPRLRRDTGFS